MPISEWIFFSDSSFQPSIKEQTSLRRNGCGGSSLLRSLLNIQRLGKIKSLQKISTAMVKSPVWSLFPLTNLVPEALEGQRFMIAVISSNRQMDSLSFLQICQWSYLLSLFCNCWRAKHVNILTQPGQYDGLLPLLWRRTLIGANPKRDFLHLSALSTSKMSGENSQHMKQL